jgi:hypothetical protein
MNGLFSIFATRRGSPKDHLTKGNFTPRARLSRCKSLGGSVMDGIIYLVGLIVIIMAILSFFGLR